MIPTVQNVEKSGFGGKKNFDPVDPQGTSDLGVGGNKIQNFQNREFLTDFYFLNANIPELC